jgi:hypothetical protein
MKDSDDPRTWEFFKFYREVAVPSIFQEQVRKAFELDITDSIVVRDIPECLKKLFYLSHWLAFKGYMRWATLFTEMFWCEVRSRHEFEEGLDLCVRIAPDSSLLIAQKSILGPIVQGGIIPS